MKRSLILILVFVSSLVLTAIKYQLYFNVFSSSMPRGIYKRLNEEPKTGLIAASCLTEGIARYGIERGYLVKGRCPTGIQPVMKRIYAVNDDTVALHNSRLIVNEKELEGFEVLPTDSKGRSVTIFYQGEQLLRQGEYWLMSAHKKNSWDSRYWGAVGVEYTLKPIWTFDENDN